MSIKKPNTSVTPEQIVEAASSWGRELSAYHAHLDAHKESFTQLQEGKWIDKYNKLNHLSVVAGKALYELVKVTPTPKKKVAKKKAA